MANALAKPDPRSDYEVGLAFLQEYFQKKNSWPGSTGLPGNPVSSYLIKDIERIGATARLYPRDDWQKVELNVLPEYGQKNPPQSAFASAFLAFGAPIDYVNVIKETAVESAGDVAKIAGAGLGLYIAVAAAGFGLALYGAFKKG